MYEVQFPGLLRQKLLSAAWDAANRSAPLQMLGRALFVGGKSSEQDPFETQREKYLRSGLLYPSYHDAVYMYDIADILPRYGYGLSPDAVVEVRNINDGPENDFLTSVSEADVVFFPFIYDRYDEEDDEYDGEAGVIRRPGTPDKTRSILAYQTFLWPQKLAESGARVAVNVQAFNAEQKGIQELSTACLAVEPFTHVAEVKNYTNGRVCDLIFKGYPKKEKLDTYKIMKVP